MSTCTGTASPALPPTTMKAYSTDPMVSKPGFASKCADKVTRGESPSATLSAPATSQPIAPDTVEPSLSWHEASVCGAGSVPAPAGRAAASETAASTTTTRRPIAE